MVVDRRVGVKEPAQVGVGRGTANLQHGDAAHHVEGEEERVVEGDGAVGGGDEALDTAAVIDHEAHGDGGLAARRQRGRGLCPAAAVDIEVQRHLVELLLGGVAQPHLDLHMVAHTE